MKTLASCCLALILLFSSCQTKLEGVFQIIADLRETYGFHTVEMTVNDKSVSVTIQDINNSDLSLSEVLALAYVLDSHLCNTYPLVDTILLKDYHFNSVGSLQLVSISIDGDGKVQEVKEY